MKKLSEVIKTLANNGKIELKSAEKFLQEIDQEREETMGILKKCEQNVGMMLGEEINNHVAKMTGRRFNAVDYHYETPVGDQ